MFHMYHIIQMYIDMYFVIFSNVQGSSLRRKTNKYGQFALLAMAIDNHYMYQCKINKYGGIHMIFDQQIAWLNFCRGILTCFAGFCPDQLAPGTHSWGHLLEQQRSQGSYSTATNYSS